MDVERILEALGVEITKSGVKEIKAGCPVHGGEDSNFGINAETGMWMCHSHCGGGNIIQLVARVKDIKLAAAKDWLKDLGVPGGLRAGAGSQLKKVRSRVAAKDKPKQRPCPPYDIKTVPTWALARGFTADIFKQYQCGYSRFYGALVIPVLQSHALIYRFNPGKAGPKYKYTEGFKAHSTLFGLGNVTLGTDGSLIIVEGPLDVLWLRQHGYGNSLAIMGGGTLGMAQRRIILDDIKPKKVIFAYDSDEAGAITAEKSVNALGKRIPCHVVQWDKLVIQDPDDDDMTYLPDDVAELTPAQIKELLATAELTEPKKRSIKAA
jgi:DNA primase